MISTENIQPVTHFLAQVCNTNSPSVTPDSYIEQLRSSGEFTEEELRAIRASILQALVQSVQRRGGR